MSLFHAFGLLARPKAEWAAIHDRRYGLARSFFSHTAVFALIPAVAGYVGTTRTGWQIGAGDVVRLTEASALRIAVLYYLAMVAAACSVAWMIHWMSRTYGASQPLGQCYALATYTATPALHRRPDAPSADPVAEPPGRTARARLHRLPLLHRGCRR